MFAPFFVLLCGRRGGFGIAFLHRLAGLDGGGSKQDADRVKAKDGCGGTAHGVSGQKENRGNQGKTPGGAGRVWRESGSRTDRRHHQTLAVDHGLAGDGAYRIENDAVFLDIDFAHGDGGGDGVARLHRRLEFQRL